MATRCKFTCVSVTKSKSWEQNPAPGREYHYSAKFQAVTSGSDENAAFFAATPAGTLEVSTVVQDVFVVGEDYYLDITPSS